MGVRRAFSGCIVLFFLAGNLLASGIPDRIVIIRGRQSSLPAEKVTRVSLADEKIAGVLVTKDQKNIILTGKNVGETDLIVWYADGRQQNSVVKVLASCPDESAGNIERRLEMLKVGGVSVIPEDEKVLVVGTVYNKQQFDLVDRIVKGQGEIAENLVLLGDDITKVERHVKELLTGVEGIEITTVGDKVAIQGKILRLQDREKIEKVAGAYPQVDNYAQLDLSVYLQESAREVTRKIGLPLVSAEPSGSDGLILKGTVLNEKEKEDAEKEARAYADKVTNLIRVEEAMIEINGYFIVSDKTFDETLGINLLSPDTFNVTFERIIEPTTSTGLIFTAAKSLAGIFPEIYDGTADNVDRWHVVTKTGREATYHQGGEVVIEVSGRDVAEVEYKQYGVIMKVTPEITSKGVINNRLSIEISAPMRSAIGGRLAFSTYKTETEVMIPHGQSLIISGTKEKINDHFRRGTPVLRDIPLLNLLFSKRGRREIYKDMILVITPTSPTYVELQKKSLSAEQSGKIEE
jgi:hypothetical protein